MSAAASTVIRLQCDAGMSVCSARDACEITAQLQRQGAYRAEEVN